MRCWSVARLAAPWLLVFALVSGQAEAACTFGVSSGGETSLQGVFDEMFGAAAAPNTETSCAPDPADALWHTVDSVGSATILVEIAGNHAGNGFGIYDSSSITTTLSIFAGPAGQASRAYITVSGGPGAWNVLVDRFSSTGGYAGSSSAVFGSSAFGFYLQQPASAGGGIFYSESFRNSGINGDPAATDYMYSYLGNGATFRDGSLYAPQIVEGTSFSPDDAILAWEDLRSGSDRDYQDMVVLLRDITPVTPVPLPAAAWLFGSALFAWGAVARRRGK